MSAVIDVWAITAKDVKAQELHKVVFYYNNNMVPIPVKELLVYVIR